jgi:HK97 family phage prohead protease
MEEIKIIKQLSAKVEATTGENPEKFLYVKSYISTYDIDLGKDRILPGAFTKSINERLSKGKNIPLLLQHNMDWLLGHAISIVEDNKGILVESRLPKSHWRVKEEIIPLLENGSLQEMSIGFILQKYREDEESEVRIIEEAKLLEYSFVTLAMNPEATIEGFKSLMENIKDERGVEKFLRQKGCSRTESKTVISVMKEILKSSNLRDEVKEESDTQRDVEEKKEESIDEEAILKSIDNILILNKLNQLCH